MMKQLAIVVSMLWVISVSAFPQIAIISPPNASPLEQLASKEVQRYLYVRMGKLFPIQSEQGQEPQSVVIATKNNPVWNLFDDESLEIITSLASDDYFIHTILDGKTKTVCIMGGGEQGTLYGAYRFVEHLDVRYGLHGDIIPDGKLAPELPTVNEQASPLFRIRGVQPFHDFPEGPDWWNANEYKSILAQLPKLGMNFFALHCYPEEFPVDLKAYPNAEPSVWIGLKDDLNEDGTVKFSYPTSWFNTVRGNWGYHPKRTSDYSFGSSNLFEEDEYGGEVMFGRSPQPETLEQSNALFDDAGGLLGDAFTFARRLGVKTCIGGETPLTVPEKLKQRLGQLGLGLDDVQTTQALYEGIFERLIKTTPIDYYWFWTPERWTWEGNTSKQIQHTKDDLAAAMRAADAVNAPFQFATCGWVLGPVQDRALFDRFLPKEFAMSCINRQVGKEPVDSAFQRIEDRSLWAIPWMEDDPNLLMPQLWAGRMRADAVDALKYGCDGLLGIHWRTRIVDPNVQALAKAAWNQEWKRDQVTRDRNQGLKGAKFITIDPRPINQTNLPELYYTQVEGPLQYSVSAPNGNYVVRLHFCETEATQPGQRAFDLLIQDATVLQSFDIFKQAGRYTALTETFRVRVTDEVLTIRLNPVKGTPRLAAFEIIGREFTQRVNCGGEELDGFEADLPLELPFYRDQPIRDFYEDWANSQFGARAASKAAEIFTSLDGDIPITTNWVRGPGSLRPDAKPWAERQREYEFVEPFEKLSNEIDGPLALERYEYWLNQFQFQKTIAQIQCEWHQYNLKYQKALKQPEAKRADYAKENVLPLRIEIVQLVETAYQLLLNTVCTTGGLGMVANWEQQNFPNLLESPAKELSRLIGESLPASAYVNKDYLGRDRLIVLTPRSLLNQEPLYLKIIWIGHDAPKSVVFKYRALGVSEWSEKIAAHVARNVYQVNIPLAELPIAGIEYYAEAIDQTGNQILAPANAPNTGWTAGVTKM